MSQLVPAIPGWTIVFGTTGRVSIYAGKMLRNIHGCFSIGINKDSCIVVLTRPVELAVPNVSLCHVHVAPGYSFCAILGFESAGFCAK